MGTKIRVDGQWVDLELNNSISPDRLDGEWLSTVSTNNRNYGQVYTNNTGKLIYVTVTVQLNSSGGSGANQYRDIAGGSLWGWVSTPNSTSTYLPPYSPGMTSNTYQTVYGDFTNICRVRDNGTNAASNLFLNVRFFVPPDCKYGVTAHNTNGWSLLSSSLIGGVLNWSEFEIRLAYPDHTFTSLDPNSNNFQRSGKAPSTAIINASNSATEWQDFMEDFAVWHEPGNIGTLGQAYSTTYTINITKAGDYTLEYAADDVGIWTFDGTQVASVVEADYSWRNVPPLSTTIQNVTVGTHTLVATVTNNSQGTNTWGPNPSGIAWRLKPFGT